MVVILPSFDEAGEYSFNGADTLDVLQEPRWHDWTIAAAILALAIGGFWILWGAETMSWVKTVR